MSEERTLAVTLNLGGEDLPVVSCRIEERLSAVTRVDVECATNSDVGAGELLGGEATITVIESGVVVRQLALIVGQGGFRRIEGGALRFEFSLYSPFWRLRHTRNIRKFRNLSAKDIITRVLGEGGIAHRWELLRDPPVRKYCTQYRESSFDFVRRLLEFEGIYFMAQDDGQLLLSDDSTTAPVVAGGGTYPLVEHAGALEGEVGIHEFGLGARVRTGKVAVNDYNWKTPAVSLLTSESADRDDELEVYEYAVGFRKPADGAALAARRLEAHRCDTAFATGSGNVARFQPGHRFRYVGSQGGEYLLASVIHEFEDPRFSATPEKVTNYRNRFEAIPAAVVYRPLAVTPKPVVQGAHTVTVRGPEGEEIHTDRYGRFRAQFHWDREAKGTDDDSRWLRKVQESGTGANLARVGWEVSVVYVDGDPDRPVGLARNINGVMVPAYGQPAEKHTMTLKTPTYPNDGGFNELKFVDRAGAMMMHWRAQKYLFNMVELDKTEQVHRDEKRIIESRLDRTVDRDQKLEIAGNRTTCVGTNRSTLVKGNRSDRIGGNETVRSDKNITVSVQKNDVENVAGMRMTLAGSISPPDIASSAKRLFQPSPGIAGATLGGGGGVGGALGGALGGGGGIGGSIAGALGGGGASAFPSPTSLLPSAPAGLGSLSGGLSLDSLTSLLTGNIGRTGQKVFSQTVGGAKISVSADQVDQDARHAFVEAIGGAKITVAGGAIGQAVGGPNLHLVGGADLRTCDEDLGIAAEKSRLLAGVAIEVKTDDKLELHGKTITIRAAQSLRLAVGEDLAIEMTPDEIAFVGPMFLSADDKVRFVAPEKDDLTAEGEAAE